MRFTLTSIFVVTIACFSGCNSLEEKNREAEFRHQQSLWQAARTTVVDRSDGISEVEAYVIGLESFAAYHNACGGVAVPRDEGAYWRVTLLAGIAGIPVEDVVIRKSDGASSRIVRNQQIVTLLTATTNSPSERVAH